MLYMHTSAFVGTKPSSAGDVAKNVASSVTMHSFRGDTVLGVNRFLDDFRRACLCGLGQPVALGDKDGIRAQGTQRGHV